VLVPLSVKSKGSPWTLCCRNELCVLVQHHVKTVMVTEALDPKEGLDAPPEHL
jgi:hypothetical protein